MVTNKHIFRWLWEDIVRHPWFMSWTDISQLLLLLVVFVLELCQFWLTSWELLGKFLITKLFIEILFCYYLDLELVFCWLSQSSTSISRSLSRNSQKWEAWELSCFKLSSDRDFTNCWRSSESSIGIWM